MCGPAAPSPQQQQTQITDLPEWAKPSAQKVLAKGEALTAQPYQTYDANRIAGFSPLQQQAFQGAQQLGPTQQTAMGSGLAAASGLGALGTGYQAGRFSGGQFTPMAAGQYMSPFIEQAMAPQLREAQRSSDIMGQQNAAKAAQMGAFGGSRQGLMEAERQRNLGMQLGDIRGRGYQTAYEQAAGQFNQDMARRMQAQQLGEQSRQFGANLGLQGLQTGLQAAGQLGALGQQQFAQQQGAIQAQSAAGAQQQALEQQGLTQAYQDFLNQQNYPYKQLGFMSDLIRGLPLGQQSTTSIYQAPPSALQTAGALGLGAYGLSKMMANGGLVGYADGGSVEAPENVANIVSKLSDQQLIAAEAAAKARGDFEQLQAIMVEKGVRASERKGMASIYNRLPPEQQAAMAGGGIVAFADNRNQPIREDMPGEEESITSTYGVGKAKGLFERLSDYGAAREAEISNPEFGRKKTADKKQETEAPVSPTFLDSDAAEAADRMTGRSSNIVSSPAAARTPSARPAEPQWIQGPGGMMVLSSDLKSGQPQSAQATSGLPDVSDLYKQIGTELEAIRGQQYPAATDMAKAIPEGMKQRRAILGENPAYEMIRQGLAGQERDRLASLKQGQGLAALAAMGDILDPGGFVRGLGKAGKTISKEYGAVLQADKAAKEAMRQSEIKLADAQYKDRVGDYEGAKQDIKEAEEYKLKALNFEANKRRGVASLIGEQAKILQNQEANQIRREQVAATRNAANAPTAIQKLASDLQRANPSLSREDALQKASYLSGYGYKTEAAQNARLATAIQKIESEYGALKFMDPNSKLAQNMIAERDRRILAARQEFARETGGSGGDGGGWSVKEKTGAK